MFPFSYGKTIKVPVSSNKIDGISEAIMNKLGDRILAEKPSSFATNQYQIKFSGGVLRFVNNWNLLVSIDYGIITVVPANDKLSVSYKLWFTELLIVTSLTTLALGGVFFLAEIQFNPFSCLQEYGQFFSCPIS